MHLAALWIVERLFPAAFRLPQPTPLDLEFLLASTTYAVGDVAPSAHAPDADHERLLAGVATAIWTLRRRMLDPATKEPKPEMKRPYTTVRRLHEQVSQAGIEIIEYENEPFDDGLSMDVLAWETVEGAEDDYILETSRPAVIWSGRRIQQAQVIVGTPRRTATSTEDREPK